jgi:hypothetical protein
MIRVIKLLGRRTVYVTHMHAFIYHIYTVNYQIDAASSNNPFHPIFALLLRDEMCKQKCKGFSLSRSVDKAAQLVKLQ